MKTIKFKRLTEEEWKWLLDTIVDESMIGPKSDLAKGVYFKMVVKEAKNGHKKA